jgi:hypothetical protein
MKIEAVNCNDIFNKKKPYVVVVVNFLYKMPLLKLKQNFYLNVSTNEFILV